ncbi:dTDP-4-dehydrorhamnose reductase [Halalkalibacter flavus]|uniref:dTDP-4-dehydrorhamnose reductase n=1 Tax=Halalkalibacter flavus TaxID=3090668 RepID=UPI002FC7993E
MKVLLTGGHGQLGKEIAILLKKKDIEHVACSREDLDITSLEAVQSEVFDYKPDVIIHAAAYTQVDLAETNEEEAFLVNGTGTRNLAEAAQEIGACLCYISTDYVFDGESDRPYKEDASTNPITVYGKSKYVGEQFVKNCNKYFIVRTSWVFGAHGNNFVKTMLKLAEERETLQVVSDQVGSPTYTADLASFLLELIHTDKYGMYHATNTGHCSWYEFARAIFEETNKGIDVKPVSTEEFLRPAPRPKFSVLDHAAIRKNHFQDLRHWREALQAFLREIGAK